MLPWHLLPGRCVLAVFIRHEDAYAATALSAMRNMSKSDLVSCMQEASTMGQSNAGLLNRMQTMGDTNVPKDEDHLMRVDAS